MKICLFLSLTQRGIQKSTDRIAGLGDKRAQYQWTIWSENLTYYPEYVSSFFKWEGWISYSLNFHTMSFIKQWKRSVEVSRLHISKERASVQFICQEWWIMKFSETGTHSPHLSSVCVCVYVCMCTYSINVCVCMYINACINKMCLYIPICI
jgi:hypothetical protein